MRDYIRSTPADPMSIVFLAAVLERTDWNARCYNVAYFSVWVWNLVSHIKKRT